MKTEHKRLMKNLDEVCRKYIKRRDNHTCQNCGRRWGVYADWSHVVPKSAGNRLRWDPLNSKVLCRDCHREWHDKPDGMEWFKVKFPDRYRYLERERVKGPKQFKDYELLEMVEEYKQKYNGLLT